jgi:sulfur carrier protein
MEEAVKDVRIKVNGEPRAVRHGVTVEHVIGEITALTSGVAAAVNGEVVPRGRWGATVLDDGDQLEVVTAVQGG